MGWLRLRPRKNEEWGEKLIKVRRRVNGGTRLAELRYYSVGFVRSVAGMAISNHHHRGRAERDFSASDFLDLLLRLDRDATGERGRRRRTGGG